MNYPPDYSKYTLDVLAYAYIKARSANLVWNSTRLGPLRFESTLRCRDLVKLYLTNTGDLLKAYKYLNMKVYMANSMEAGKTPDYQILSIENGVAQFNMEGESSESYTIEVVGGGYRLVSADADDWSEGWSIVPEIYCEVSQR